MCVVLRGTLWVLRGISEEKVTLEDNLDLLLKYLCSHAEYTQPAGAGMWHPGCFLEPRGLGGVLYDDPPTRHGGWCSTDLKGGHLGPGDAHLWEAGLKEVEVGKTSLLPRSQREPL